MDNPNVPWEAFAVVFAALISLIVYTWRDLVKRVDRFGAGLEQHKLWASDNYIKKVECKDHRDDCREKCPTRKEALAP